MDTELERLKEKILEQADSLPEEQAAALHEKIEGMNQQEFENFLKQFALPLQECIFCQIIKGRIPTVKIYESRNILAILDINPAAKGHMLVMPRQHYQFLTQLPDALLFEIFGFVRHIIPAIIRAVKSKGVTISILQGKEQLVPHFVVNIIPRFDDDRISFAFKRARMQKDELEKIAIGIRQEAGNMAKERMHMDKNQIEQQQEQSEQDNSKEVAEEEAEAGGKEETAEENEPEETANAEDLHPDEEAEEETAADEQEEDTEEPESEFSKDELAKFFRGRIPS